MELICAHCRKPFVKRSRRAGMLDRALSLVYAYPFSCQLCGNRFHLMQWGIRYIEKDVDRRQYERRPVKMRVRITGARGDHEGTVLDLAVGGCAIETSTPFQPGDLLGLSLDAFDNNRQSPWSRPSCAPFRARAWEWNSCA